MYCRGPLKGVWAPSETALKEANGTKQFKKKLPQKMSL